MKLREPSQVVQLPSVFEEGTKLRTAFQAGNFTRLPGFYRRWELAAVVEGGREYHLESAGFVSDGTPLFAVFRREPERRAQ